VPGPGLAPEVLVGQICHIYDLVGAGEAQERGVVGETLNRLPRRQSAEMIAYVTGGKALPKEISDQIVDRTDGVPLFIEELTKTVVESGIVAEAGDHYAMARPIAPLAIPTSLQASLLARLDRLATTREVAQIGAFFQDNYVAGADWRRIDGEWLGSATELALALQSYTNNTSLVLALEVGEPGKGDVLLFAADAQVGNWESWQTWTCETNGVKMTGPDLLKRTIFYKVGHHGSHNATLKGHGVEEMDGLKAAIIPVDEAEAKKKRWGSMPLPDLIAALEKKAPGMVLRTDQEPVTRASNVVIDDKYFEVIL